MARRCSHCGANGHNSRTCPARAGSAGCGGVVKLFGVNISEGRLMKKSASMGNISNFSSSASSAASPRDFSISYDFSPPDGYASDDTNQAACSSSRRERKKGTPWTEEEHRMFLLGLQRLGKGDWRGIARNFVLSRTPTQVASHAQKYFIRQSNISRRKRRFSLFDMVKYSVHPRVDPALYNSERSIPSPEQHFLPDQEINKLEASSVPSDHQEEVRVEIQPHLLPQISPGFYSSPASVPIILSPWPSTDAPVKKQLEGESHENIDQLARMVNLRLGDASAEGSAKSGLSLGLIGSPSKQSAFHIDASMKTSMFSQSKDNAVHAL